MAAKAVVVKDITGLPIQNAEATLMEDQTWIDILPLTNPDGYTLSKISYNGGNFYLKVFANNYKPYLQLVTLDDQNQEIHIGGDPNFGPPNTIHLPPINF